MRYTREIQYIQEKSCNAILLNQIYMVQLDNILPPHCRKGKTRNNIEEKLFATRKINFDIVVLINIHKYCCLDKYP